MLFNPTLLLLGESTTSSKCHIEHRLTEIFGDRCEFESAPIYSKLTESEVVSQPIELRWRDHHALCQFFYKSPPLGGLSIAFESTSNSSKNFANEAIRCSAINLENFIEGELLSGVGVSHNSRGFNRWKRIIPSTFEIGSAYAAFLHRLNLESLYPNYELAKHDHGVENIILAAKDELGETLFSSFENSFSEIEQRVFSKLNLL